MKNIFLLLILLINFISCFPSAYVTNTNPQPFKGKYTDSFEKNSTIIAEGFNFIIEKLPDGKIIRKTFYPSTGQMTQYLTSSDLGLNGKFIDWYDNGNKWKEGNFKDNKKIGEWKEYSYFTGKLIEFGSYENGLKSGLWTHLDSLGNKIRGYNYREGKLNGEFKLWDKNGKLVGEGQFREGELISETILDENSEIKNIRSIEKMAEFKGCETILDKKERKTCSDNKMLQFIYRNIKYPHFAREYGIEGMAIMRFVVNEEGKITEVIPYRGLCDEIRDECLRIVKIMPDWNAGINKGEKIKTNFLLPVKFKLE